MRKFVPVAVFALLILLSLVGLATAQDQLSITCSYDTLLCEGCLSTAGPNPFHFRVRIDNNTGMEARNVRALIHIPANMRLVSGDSMQHAVPSTIRNGEYGTCDYLINFRSSGSEDFTVSLTLFNQFQRDLNMRILLVDGNRNVTSRALTEVGFTYTSADLETLRQGRYNWSDFGILLVGYDFSTFAMNALIAQRDSIAAFFRRGGRILVFGQEADNRIAPWIPLPANDHFIPGNDQHIVDHYHPLLEGFTDAELSDWTYSFHSYFTDLDPAWDTLAVQTSTGMPTILVSDINCGESGGSMILSGQDYDWHIVNETDTVQHRIAVRLMQALLDYFSNPTCYTYASRRVHIPICHSSIPETYLVRPNTCPGFTACPNEVIQLRLTDTYGIDPATIRLRVGVGVHTVGDGSTSWSAPNLIYRPGPLTHGQVIDFALEQALSINGCEAETFSCQLIADLRGPLARNPIPPDGGYVNLPSQPIRFTLVDQGASGVAAESLLARHFRITRGVGDTVRTFHVSLTDSIVTIEDVWTSNNDTVRVCLLQAWDRVDSAFCGPNTMGSPFCWQYIIDQTPPVDSLYGPVLGGVVSCPAETVLFRIREAYDLDWSQIALSDGETTWHMGPNLVFRPPDTLAFLPPVPWTEGVTETLALTGIVDLAGNLGLPETVRAIFRRDTQPPVLVDWVPGDGDTADNGVPRCSVRVVDVTAGLDESLTRWSYALNGSAPTEIAWPNPALTRHDDWLVLDMELLGIHPHGGDSIRFRLTTGDRAIDCGPNDTTETWRFYFSALGPFCTPLDPPEGAWVACPAETVRFLVQDPSGVDWSTVRVQVNAISRDWPNGMDRRGDTLRIFLGGLADGMTVSIRLLRVDDSLGNALRGVTTLSFRMDLAPPRLVATIPSAPGPVRSPDPSVDLLLRDAESGVDFAGLIVGWDTTLYPVDDSILTWFGDTARFSLAAAGGRIPDNDTLRLCLAHLTDRAVQCPANAIPETCLAWRCSYVGPTVREVFPSSGGTVACEGDSIWLDIHLDDPNGIDYESIRLEVDGATYDWASGRLGWLGWLRYVPLGGWPEGRLIRWTLLAAPDGDGNPLPLPVTDSFRVDRTAPAIVVTTPTAGETLRDPYLAVDFTVHDLYSALDTSAIQVRINGLTIDWPSPALWIDAGGTFHCRPESLGVRYFGGDTLVLCVLAADAPTYCGPNRDSVCLTVTVETGGPRGQLVFPAGGSVTGCADTVLVLWVRDSTGLDTLSLGVTVQGVSYNYIDRPEHLSCSGETLRVVPEYPFADGDLVMVTLDSLYDRLRNPFQGGRAWSFRVDLSGPAFTNELPPDGGASILSHPVIGVDIADLWSPLIADSFSISFLGSTFVWGDTVLHWDGSRLTIRQEAVPIELHRGDTIEVCVAAADSVAYCPHGLTRWCWSYVIAGEGPRPTFLVPDSGQITACARQDIRVLLEDTTDGVDWSSVRLTVRDTVYGPGAPLSHSGDTLVWTPSVDFAHGETVRVEITRADDSIGNPLYGGSQDFWFVVDLQPPSLDFCSMAGRDTSTDWELPCTLVVGDRLAGIVTDSVCLRVYGPRTGDRRYCGPGSAFGPQDTTWVFNPARDTPPWQYHEFDTVQFTLTLRDRPDLCPPNETTYTWSLRILDDDSLPPEIRFGGPDSVRAHSPFVFHLEARDTSGLWLDGSWLIVTTATGEETLGWHLDSVANGWYYFSSDTLTAPDEGWDLAPRLHLCDDDTDFAYALDRACLDTLWPVPVVFNDQPPEVRLIHPVDEGFSACDPSRAVLWIHDTNGVDWSTLVVTWDSYGVPNDSLEFDGDTVIVHAPVPVADGAAVELTVLNVADSLGNALPAPVRFHFTVDRNPPRVLAVTPAQGQFVSDPGPRLVIRLSDPISDIDSARIEVWVEGLYFHAGSPGFSVGREGGLVAWVAIETALLTAPPQHGDTLRWRILLTDVATDCPFAAVADSGWFIYERLYECDVHPDPFTPNLDGFNETCVFEFPGRDTESGRVRIYNAAGRLVRTLETALPTWDGRDDSGSRLPRGTYIYEVSRGETEVCRGTVLLAQ